MACKGKNTTGRRTRQAIQGLFDRGNIEGAVTHRLRLCASASRCGRLCANLIKGPGAGQVACVDVATPGARPGEQAPLYQALADPAFHCPQGRF